MKIVTTGKDSYENHRGDFTTCPHCDVRYEYSIWEKNTHTLVLNPRCYKAGSVALLSECPACFKSSWVHENISLFGLSETWPKKWIERVDELGKQLKISAARKWAKSLCVNCKHLTEIKIEYSEYRHCKRGCGPTETECDTYEKLTD